MAEALHRVMQMGAGRPAGRADVADHLILAYLGPAANSPSGSPEVTVYRHVLPAVA